MTCETIRYLKPAVTAHLSSLRSTRPAEAMTISSMKTKTLKTSRVMTRPLSAMTRTSNTAMARRPCSISASCMTSAEKKPVTVTRDRTAASGRPTRRLMAKGGWTPAVMMSTGPMTPRFMQEQRRQGDAGHGGKDQEGGDIGRALLRLAEESEGEGATQTQNDDVERAYHFRSLNSEMSRLRRKRNRR